MPNYWWYTDEASEIHIDQWFCFQLWKEDEMFLENFRVWEIFKEAEWGERKIPIAQRQSNVGITE